MHRFEMVVHTDDANAAAMRALIRNDSEDSLMLDLERLIGLHGAGDDAALRQFRSAANNCTEFYGQGVVEVTDAYERN